MKPLSQSFAQFFATLSLGASDQQVKPRFKPEPVLDRPPSPPRYLRQAAKSRTTTWLAGHGARECARRRKQLARRT